MKVSFPAPKIIKTNGINMEVFEQGEGFPVIMLHGFPELAYSWRFQIPVLAEAGYRAIAVNQRGYGGTDKPEPVEEYDLRHRCDDMVGLMDALGLEKAVFVGHDIGCSAAWSMSLRYPDRVAGVVGLSVPFYPRGKVDFVTMCDEMFGPEHYVVHFNRKPGVADAAFGAKTRHFLSVLFRRPSRVEQPKVEQPAAAPTEKPSYNISMMDLLAIENPSWGEPLMSDEEMDVFVDAFEKSGFTGPINWYRNFRRDWETSAELPQRIDVPCGIIYGKHDASPDSKNTSRYVPNLETITLDCGHWTQQEEPEAVNTFLVEWLNRNAPF